MSATNLPPPPRPPNGMDPIWYHQLKTWLTDLQGYVHRITPEGDHSTIAAKPTPGGTSLSYIGPIESKRSFHCKFSQGFEKAKQGDILVNGGTVRTIIGSNITLADATINLPGSGDLWVFVRIDFNFSAGSITASIQNNATEPTYSTENGTNQRMEIPLCFVEEIQTGVWEIDIKHIGDIFIDSISPAKVKVTGADITQQFLNDKITVVSPLKKEVQNPGALENLELEIDPTLITGYVAGKRRYLSYDGNGKFEWIQAKDCDDNDLNIVTTTTTTTTTTT